MLDMSYLCWDEEIEKNIQSVKGTARYIEVTKIKPMTEIRDRKAHKTSCDKVNYQEQSGPALQIAEGYVAQ